MASKILDKYGNSVEQLSLVPSSGGVYDVIKNGTLIYSNKKQGRFPELEEIYELLES